MLLTTRSTNAATSRSVRALQTGLWLVSVTACASSPARSGSPQPTVATEVGATPAPLPVGAAVSGPRPLTETTVDVSTRRVRIAFPADSTGTWGWPARGRGAPAGEYTWSVLVDGMDEPTVLGLWLYQQDSAARTFATLEQLVAEGRRGLCTGGMVQTCSELRVTAAVEHQRVVLRLTDSAAIARLFGMRPAEVRVFRRSPDETASYPSTSVPVRYVDPPIPLPDSATRADAARSRRRYEASIMKIARSIAGPGRRWTVLWLAVGDSAALGIEERQCHIDVCTSAEAVAGDSGWSVADTSIVRLRSDCAEPVVPAMRRAGERCFVYGLRTGRTTVAVHGVHGPSDTAASRSPPATALTRTIVVGPPLARVVITSRPDTVLLGKPMIFRVTAYDRAGKPVRDVPIDLMIQVGPYTQRQDATSPSPVRFETPGLRRVIAAFRGLADTLTVTVVDPSRPATATPPPPSP